MIHTRTNEGIFVVTGAARTFLTASWSVIDAGAAALWPPAAASLVMFAAFLTFAVSSSQLTFYHRVTQQNKFFSASFVNDLWWKWITTDFCSSCNESKHSQCWLIPFECFSVFILSLQVILDVTLVIASRIYATSGVSSTSEASYIWIFLFFSFYVTCLYLAHIVWFTCAFLVRGIA